MNMDFGHRSQVNLSLHCADSCMLDGLKLNAQALKLGQQDLFGHCHHACESGNEIGDFTRMGEEQTSP